MSRARRCGNKVRHATRHQAQSQIAGLVAAGAAEDAHEEYRCECGWWHVGHAKRRRATIRDRRAS